MINIIFGGSSGLGKDLVYEAAKKNISSIIIARNKTDLEIIASDIFLKYKVKICYIAFDLSKNDQNYNLLYSFLKKNIREKVDYFFTIGYVNDSDMVFNFDSNFDKIFNTNFKSIARIVNFLIKSKLLNETDSLNFFGSIASIRGRSKNVFYSCSKKALISYYESLRHSLKNNVNLFLLGYMDTRMIEGKKIILPAGSPTLLARKIVNNKNKNFGYVYYPYYWFFIRLIIKLIPWKIYKKIDF